MQYLFLLSIFKKILKTENQLIKGFQVSLNFFQRPA